MMNFLNKLLAFEKTWAHDKTSKKYFLVYFNFALMGFFLFIILAGLNHQSFFYLPINNNDLTFLFIVYLFLNFSSFLIQKSYIRLATLFTIFILLLALFQATLSLGVDFYVIDSMYPFLILMSAVLVNPKFALFIFVFISLTILAIFFLQSNGYVVSNSTWKTSIPNFSQISIVLISYALMVSLVWLSFKEIELKSKKIKNSQLEKLVKLIPLLDLGKLTTGLIREIRNQLSVISIVLQNAQANKNTVNDLDLAFEAVDQIDNLTKLSLCKLSDQADLEVFNLNLEIKNMINLFKDKSRKKKIRIIFEPNKSYQLHADRMKLDQVLLSLILNAIESYEHTKNNDKNIFIKLIKKPRNLLIKVKDYGVGIDKKHLASIFNPYFTLKDTTKALGLSLYVSQETMTKAYATKIKVESSIGVGSTFTLYIKNKFLLI